MSSLPNYLRIHRKRLALSQQEVGFLMGNNGMSKGSTVSRDEHFSREPSLRTALAYQLIYGKPIHELFAGIYQEVQVGVSERAGLLRHRQSKVVNPKRMEAISRVILGKAIQTNDQ